MPHPRCLPVGALVLTMLACGPSDPRDAPPTVGQPVPDFGAPTLAGDSVTLASLRGRPVLLNVWATWCPPCRREMPWLQELHEAYGEDGLAILGVSIDGRGSVGAIEQFTDSIGVRYTILHDRESQVTERFQTLGVPETFLIDPEGVLAYRWSGPFDPMAPEVQNRIRAMLDMEPLAAEGP